MRLVSLAVKMSPAEKNISVAAVNTDSPPRTLGHFKLISKVCFGKEQEILIKLILIPEVFSI